MPIDRAATLRNAEKLLGQGKLDAAIAAYASLVEDQPSDWSTANTLGDLYVRAGQSDRAAALFNRSADQLSSQGFAAKAAALYKKVLKLKPTDEHALVQAGQIAASQGLFVDARAHFTAAAEQRANRGDARGATEMRIRIGTLDPSDFDRRTAAARERALIDDVAGAIRDFKAIARELGDARRPADAIAALAEAARLAPDDGDLRTQLLAAHIEAGDLIRARECASTAEDLKTLAAVLEAGGRQDEALDALRDAVRLAPGDQAATLRLARAFLARGDMAAAIEFLTPETAHADPQLMMAAADHALRSGRLEDGIGYARWFVDEDPEGREQIALLSSNLAEEHPEAAGRVLDVAIDNAVRRGSWSWAHAALQEFVRRAPYHMPALLRLVEVCVDGGLESEMYAAQARLADAYLAMGAAAEARVIAEGLVEHSPDDPDHAHRLRRARALLDEDEPEAVAAQVDAPLDERPILLEAVEDDLVLEADTDVAIEIVDSENLVANSPRDPNFALGPNAIDIESILGEFEGASRARTPDAADRPRATSGDDEVDLTVALSAIKPVPLTAGDLDGVFQQLREEVTRRSPTAVADASYNRALALQQAGDIDGCIAALETATRAPQVRFAAASQLGRVLKSRGRTAEAVEWLERAAEAAPPDSDAANGVLYDLADVLESSGETERALAVWLELQAAAGEYRDVGARIDVLTKGRG